MTERISYMVGHGWAESVSDTTALPHRVLDINGQGDIIVTSRRPSIPYWGGDVIHQMSGAELAFLAREARRAARRRFWARLVGKRPTPPDVSGLRTSAASTIVEVELRAARAIRERVSPMRHPDGSLNVSAVAQEATLRERAGLPSWIAELDGPGKVGP